MQGKIPWDAKEAEPGFTWKLYEDRVRQMRTLIPSGTASVLDFGAGVMFLKSLLPRDIRYYPVDFKKRTEDTIVCDFNLRQFPEVTADVGFCSGILEYIEDMDWFVEQLSRHVDTVVLSYCPHESVPDMEQRISRGWVNDFTTEEIIECFGKFGFYLSEWDHTYPFQQLFRLRKTSPALLCDNFFCSGCGACANICSSGALSMGRDEYGYYIPVLDEALCTGCRRCTDICPTIHIRRENTDTPACWAVAMDDAERADSSSGGVFPVLSRWALQNRGVVCGAAWAEDFSVRHIAIEQAGDLPQLRHSKYLQSDMGMIYRSVKEYLRQGRPVLFSGSPCQVAGLYAYLGRDYDNLYTVDLICAQAPSAWFFQKYLEETFGAGNVVNYIFRDKQNGWNPWTHRVRLKDGTELVRGVDEDLYQQAFLPRLMMPRHCEECRYCGFPRQGDITIGDYHGIGEHDASLNDGKGLSALLVNNAKGERLLAVLQDPDSHSNVIVETPLEWVKEHNRVRRGGYNKRTEVIDGISQEWGMARDTVRGDGFDAHICRDTFYNMILDHSFKDSVMSSYYGKRDVGILGCWSEPNYGSEVTYYALYHVVRALGYSVLLFERPMDAPWHGAGEFQLFRKNPVPPGDLAEPFPSKRDMRALNERCEIFVVGSDQMWPHNNNITFGEICYLDFIHRNKTIITYATSYGTDRWDGDELHRAENAYYLDRFDAVSVREKSGVELSEKLFGIKAEWVIDPVFLCDRSVFSALADRSAFGSGKYIGAYILDVTPEKEEALRYLSGKLGLPLEIITDAKTPQFDRWELPVNRDVYAEDWLKMFRDCEFVVTDSFHGMCLAVVFQKPFVAFINENRGATRFTEYGQLLGLTDYIVRDPKQLLQWDHFPSVDYERVYQVLEPMKERSHRWLQNALVFPGPKRMSGFDIATKRIDEVRSALELLKHEQEGIGGVLYDARIQFTDWIQNVEEQGHRNREELRDGLQILEQNMGEHLRILERDTKGIGGVLYDARIQFTDWIRNVEEQGRRDWEELRHGQQILEQNMGEHLRILEQDTSGRMDRMESAFHKELRDCLQSLERDMSGRMDRMESAFYEEKQRLCSQIDEGNYQLSLAVREIEDIRASATYKIGRFVTWLPRKMRGGIRCWRENGAVYTFKRILFKLQNIWRKKD